MNAKDIQGVIARHFMLKSQYPVVAQNCRWNRAYEADVFAIKNSMYTVEVEVKLSLSDFKADFKKSGKHFFLRNTKYSHWIPNYFYFAMPAELANKVDIPEYAGHIIVQDEVMTVHKKAPRLHSDKIGEQSLMKVMRTLSERDVFGCSKLAYLNKRHLNAPEVKNSRKKI